MTVRFAQISHVYAKSVQTSGAAQQNRKKIIARPFLFGLFLVYLFYVFFYSRYFFLFVSLVIVSFLTEYVFYFLWLLTEDIITCKPATEQQQSCCFLGLL